MAENSDLETDLLVVTPHNPQKKKLCSTIIIIANGNTSD
jgi:hypothetical protein